MGAPYNQRKPEKTPLYQVVSDHYDTFRNTYNDKYGDVYGFFRPEIEKEIGKYKKCGIFKHGMAKVKCKKKGCDEEYYLPFSCHGRGLCPSCIQVGKRQTPSDRRETPEVHKLLWRVFKSFQREEQKKSHRN
jgi:hypothetical protein